MGSTAKGVPYPDLGDAPNVPSDMAALASWVDARPGVQTLTYAQIQALSGADLWLGRCVFQSDTGANRPVAGPYWYNGAGWRQPWDQPWGVLPSGLLTITANQANFGTEADIVGLSWAGSLVANRIIRATVRFGFSQNSSGHAVVVVNDGSLSHNVWSQDNAAGETGRANGAYEFVSAAGAITLKARASSTGSTVDIVASATSPSRLVVEDIGPGGAPA